jgi:hypothetical protein
VKDFIISDITSPLIVSKAKLERCHINTLDASEVRVSASTRLPLFKVDHGNEEKPAQKTAIFTNAPKKGLHAVAFTLAMTAAEEINHEVTANVSQDRNFNPRNGICSSFPHRWDVYLKQETIQKSALTLHCY